MLPFNLNFLSVLNWNYLLGSHKLGIILSTFHSSTCCWKVWSLGHDSWNSIL